MAQVETRVLVGGVLVGLDFIRGEEMKTSPLRMNFSLQLCQIGPTKITPLRVAESFAARMAFSLK